MMKRLFLILLVLLPGLSRAQESMVTGTVVDPKGEPLAGAFVLCRATGVGTMADGNGAWSLRVAPDAVLSVSCIGFKEISEPVSGRSRIDFVMQEDALLMDAAVVVGYGTQRAKDLTAPVANVRGEELARQVTSNPMSALQGKVAGVQVIGTGVPGGVPAVRIRGIGSIGDYARPLYVVDGVFVEDLGFVSNNDIQEMTVLKDASAAAIYGVRAANGVIIVTTKKGTAGRTDISYDGYAGLQVPVNVMKLANAAQYVDLVNQAFANTTGYVKKNLADFPSETDWYAALVRNAVQHSHSLDVSGANAATSYAFGLNYLYQDGIQQSANNYRRINLRARVDQQVKDWLRLGANALVSQYRRRDPADVWLQAFINPPVYGIYNENNAAAYPEKFDSPQLWGFPNAYGNPYASAWYHDSGAQGLNLVFSTYAEMRFWGDRLKLRSSYNLDFQGYESYSYQPEFKVGGSQGVSDSSMSKTYGLRYKHIIDNTLTYADRRNAHAWTLMLGQSLRTETLRGMRGSSTGIPDIDAQSRYIGLGSQKNISVTDLIGVYTYNGLSFFSRGTYNYGDRYLATLTFRADGSSKYNRKWGLFPSVGLGWVLTGEPFMQQQRVVDYLKLRASWGLLGNDSVPANSAVILGASGYGASAVFNDVLVDGLGAQTVYQNFLEWEVVNEFDIGVDFAFLDNRLSGELDYYNRTTTNAVFYVPIATGGGTSELLANNGTVRNDGFELGLNWHESVSDKFSYHVGGNLTTIRNRVISLIGRDYIPGASVRDNFSTRTMVGYPIGTFWGYEIDGVYETARDAMLGPSQAVTGAGYFKYRDQNGDEIIDDKDKVSLGSAIPKLLAGLDFGINYGGFDLSATLQGQSGNKILNAKRMNRGTFPQANYDLDFYENAWREDAKSDTYPSAEAYTSAYMQQANSFFVEDGSYLRLQNVQLGYTLRGKDDRSLVKSIRFSLSAQRPYTWFRYNGFTTEIGGSPISAGVDNSVYPMQAVYTFGMKMNF